ncbi:MAG: tRNA (adenosine(37)-N6)-threonylcarbamoyltransferase complex dimerization subunit type 1 TsaB [Chitinophagaceae bacterium]
MAIILNIDTAVETASVCLAREAQPLQFAANGKQKDHASWLHPILQKVMADAGLTKKDIEAIAVTIGPGSYTGLRVGLAAVKGLCYALQIPLIAVNTLEMMAYATSNEEADLYCPLIDARRMEVFTSVYDKNLTQLIEPKAMIIDPTSFESMLASNKILFSGNGSEKLKNLINHSNALFSNKVATAADMVDLSERYFRDKKFGDVAYIEPLYIKEFYSAAR